MAWAKVAELVDALDLGSSAARRESSSLSFRTRGQFEVVSAGFSRIVESHKHGCLALISVSVSLKVP